MKCVLFFLTMAATAIAAETPTTEMDSFEGIWSGTVAAPNATTEIGFAFQRDAHGLNASFTMPAMFVAGMHLGPARIVDGAYLLPELGVKLTRHGDRLVGTFANPLLHVTLQRAQQLPAEAPIVPWPAGPAPAWTHSLSAETWASPVVRDGTVYVGCVDGQFHALRARDGAELWAWKGEHPIYGEALVTADNVYVADDAVDLVALHRADGRLAWRRSLREVKSSSEAAPKNPTFNHRVPVPALAGETLYVGSVDHGVYAIDAANGQVRWRKDVGAPVHASVTVDRGELIVGCYDGSVVVLDRATGAEKTRTKLGGPVASAPVVAGDTVLVGCRDYLLYGLKRADLGIAWRDSYWFSWIESVPRIVDGVAYIGGSDYRRISALDPATGSARWATDVGGLTWGTPLVTGATVYGGTSAQRPAAIAHEGGITALDRATGQVKWRIVMALPPQAARAGVIGSLALADGKIIAVSFDGLVGAYPAE